MHHKYVTTILLLVGFFILLMTIMFMTKQTFTREVPDSATPLIMPATEKPGK
jgi:hypothetical protein